jgi:hypothetical protein
MIKNTIYRNDLRCFKALFSIVTYPDPVTSGNFWSDSDPNVYDRIPTLALINDLTKTVFVCINAIYF